MKNERSWADHFLKGLGLIYSVSCLAISIFWFVSNWKDGSYGWAFAILILPMGWFGYGERMRRKKNKEIRLMNQRILHRFNQEEL